MQLRELLLLVTMLTFVVVGITAHAQPQPRVGAVALFKAAEAGNITEIRRLLTQGVPADTADSDGWTALMLAASEGKLAAVQALVKAGADVNWAAKSGETPLMAATLPGHMAVVKYLLSEGADKTARTRQGLTAGDMAERAKKPDLAKLLYVAGGRPAAAAPPAPPPDPRKGLETQINAAAEAFKAGRHDEATKLFQEVVAQDPQHALAWHFLGQSLAAAGKKDEARSAYEKSLALQASGTLAERNTIMLAQLRRGGEPKLPPEISEQTRQFLLKNPLFTTLPDSKELRCTDVLRFDYPDGRWNETTSKMVWQPGTGGVFIQSNVSSRTSSTGAQPSDTYERVATVGGLLNVTTKFYEKTSPSEIVSAEGSLFPLSAGRKFGFRYDSKDSPHSYDYSCEVLNRVNTAPLGIPLGPDDTYQVRCNARFTGEKISFVGTDMVKSIETNAFETFHLCSESLGLCPYSWGSSQGSEPPNFSKPYTSTGSDGKTRITRSRVCER